MRVVFRAFDADKSGSVNRAEFRRGLAHLGVAVADDEFERLLAIVDADGGGDIDYTEFAKKLKAKDAQTDDGFSREGATRKALTRRPGPLEDRRPHGRRGGDALMELINLKVEQKSNTRMLNFHIFVPGKRGDLAIFGDISLRA